MATFKKMISPSSMKYLDISKDVRDVIFNHTFNTYVSKDSEFNKYMLFVGNAVHYFIEYYINKKLTRDNAYVNAILMAKKKSILKVDVTQEVIDVIDIAIDKALEFLNNKTYDIEVNVYAETGNSLYDTAIGGTADIVIYNDDNTVTIADFKNYRNPNSSNLYKHYIQCLAYANLISKTQNVKIKDIQIVYNLQDEVVTLPYQEIDLDNI